MDRIKVTAAICSSFAKTLIFCRTKRGADRLVRTTQKEASTRRDPRRPAPESARKGLADFSGDRLAVLVATDVAARGLHIDAVDCVIHFDPRRTKRLPSPLRTDRARRLDGGCGLFVTVEPNY